MQNSLMEQEKVAEYGGDHMEWTAQVKRGFIKTTDHRPTNHQPTNQTPRTHRPTDHRLNDHRHNDYI